MEQIVEPTKEEHDLACAMSALEGLSTVADSSISYDDFYRIIAAAKSAGVDDAAIHAFCSRSQKYRPTEIQKKIDEQNRAYLQENCPLYFDRVEGLYRYLFEE